MNKRFTGDRLVLIFFAAITTLLTQCERPLQNDLVITGATLIDGTGAAPRTETTLTIRDGRIVSVTPDGEADLPAGATVIVTAVCCDGFR